MDTWQLIEGSLHAGSSWLCEDPDKYRQMCEALSAFVDLKNDYDHLKHNLAAAVDAAAEWKMREAHANYERDQTIDAMRKIESFINELYALRGEDLAVARIHEQIVRLIP